MRGLYLVGANIVSDSEFRLVKAFGLVQNYESLSQRDERSHQFHTVQWRAEIIEIKI